MSQAELDRAVMSPGCNDLCESKLAATKYMLTKYQRMGADKVEAAVMQQHNHPQEAVREHAFGLSDAEAVFALARPQAQARKKEVGTEAERKANLHAKSLELHTKLDDKRSQKPEAVAARAARAEKTAQLELDAQKGNMVLSDAGIDAMTDVELDHEVRLWINLKTKDRQGRDWSGKLYLKETIKTNLTVLGKGKAPEKKLKRAHVCKAFISAYKKIRAV